MAFSLQLFHNLVLMLGQQVGFEFRDAGFCGNATGGALVVTGEHDHALEAFGAQLFHNLCHVFFQRILDVQHTPQGVVHRQEQRRSSRSFFVDGFQFFGGNGHMLVFQHEVLRTDYAALAVDAGSNAVGNHIFHFRMALAMLQPLLQRLVHYGACHGVGEMLFQAGGQAKHLFSGHFVVAGYFAHGRRCLGERARFVEHDNVGFCHVLEVA